MVIISGGDNFEVCDRLVTVMIISGGDNFIVCDEVRVIATPGGTALGDFLPSWVVEMCSWSLGECFLNHIMVFISMELQKKRTISSPAVLQGATRSAGAAPAES